MLQPHTPLLEGRQQSSCFTGRQGYCANSLELGCDCLGHIQYFDGVLNDTKGAQHAWFVRLHT